MPREPRAARSFRWPSSGQVRLLLITFWIMVVVVIAAVGERPATLTDLMQALDARKVSSVDVGGGMPAGGSGWTTQQVRWRQGLSGRHAEVLYATPGYEQQAADSNQSSMSTISGDVVTLIREHDPNVQVEVSARQRTSTATMLRWEVPPWLLLISLSGLALTLWLIANGPEPWRATRWGWAWATLLTGPVGAMAFAVLSGPTTWVPSPKADARRLTGGWSFVLMVLLTSILQLS